MSNKHVKLVKSAAGKIASPLGKNSSNFSQSLVVTSEHCEDVRSQNLSHAPGISSKKKSAEIKMNLDPSSSIKISNGDAPLSLAEPKDIEKLKAGGVLAKNLTDKVCVHVFDKVKSTTHH